VNQQRLLERFLRYVQIDTTAQEFSDSYPSSPGQLELGRLVCDELRQIGLADVRQSRHGIVTATLPATVPGDLPVVALCAHLDTSPETTGRGVRPQVVRNYDGRDLVLPGDPRQVIRVAQNPELAKLIGKTLVTSDGTTLLGADAKAGVAVIVETIAYLSEHPQIAHGPLRVCLTCDEEIGHGVDHLDLDELAATVCYTLDGPGTDHIDVETFSADRASVVIRGVSIHTMLAKGRLVNAMRAAADFLTRLPSDGASPETTEGQDGFLHPYHLSGGAPEVEVRILIRDFDTTKLADWAETIREAAQATQQAYPGSQIDVQITPQYRNLADGLAKMPQAVQFAVAAHERLGRTARLTHVRGGTDGSLLTAKGLPTPNLSTGEHNPHSPLEWTCVEEMVAAGEILVELVQIWATADGAPAAPGEGELRIPAPHKKRAARVSPSGP